MSDAKQKTREFFEEKLQEEYESNDQLKQNVDQLTQELQDAQEEAADLRQ